MADELIADLLEVARDDLRRLIPPDADVGQRLHLAMIGNVMAIAARTLCDGRRLDIETRDEIASLLDRHGGDREALDRQLAAAIRADRVDDDVELRALLRRRSERRRWISRPRKAPAANS